MGARAGCEPGRSDELLRSRQWSLRGVPYLITDVSIRRRRGKSPGGQVELSITRRKLSGFPEKGSPSYSRSEETRVFPEKGLFSADIPVLLADEGERNAFQAYDVLLRIRGAAAGESAVASYGEVSIRSDTPRADILLDGGLVARTSEAPTLVKNVVTGQREVRVRDSSGREARKVVRVFRNRRIAVTLNLRKPAQPSLPGGLVSLGTNPEGAREYWRSKDGVSVVEIPGGEFLMGSAADEGEPPEHPQRRVFLSPYLIDKTETSWGQYRKFATATGRPLPETPVWGTPDDYPVTAVTWSEASEFCNWVGGRLPTEAEWEKAARGTDGRRYPWGDEWDPTRCNTRDGGPHRPEGVGAFPGCVSPYGVLDMIGGVWEFCEDWFDEKYYEAGPTRDPRGPASGQLRVIRGGSWLESSQTARPALRRGTDPPWRYVRHGFRCAQDAPESTR